jgi:hypothetical protein
MDKATPESQDYIKRFLGDNSHVRSKYLDFAMKPHTNPMAPDELGKAVDYFHNAKNQKGFNSPKDIGSYPTHESLKTAMDNHLRSAIPDEVALNHPDTSTTYNQDGVRATKLHSINAALATRDPRHMPLKKCRDNSWCVSEKPSQEDIEISALGGDRRADQRDPEELRNQYMEYEHPFHSYDDHHLIQYRDPKNGETRTSLYGRVPHDPNGSHPGYEINNERQEGDQDGHYLPDHVKDAVYKHGPGMLKGNLRFAPEDEMLNRVRKGVEHLSPSDIDVIMKYGRRPARELIRSYGKDVPASIQRQALTNPITTKDLIDAIGGSHNLSKQLDTNYWSPRYGRNPISHDVAHTILDGLPKRAKISPSILNLVAHAAPEPEFSHLIIKPFNRSVIQKLINNVHGSNIDKETFKTLLRPRSKLYMPSADNLAASRDNLIAKQRDAETSKMVADAYRPWLIKHGLSLGHTQ